MVQLHTPRTCHPKIKGMGRKFDDKEVLKMNGTFELKVGTQ
jgi:hypothetical protein